MHFKCKARDHGPDEGKNRNHISHREIDASRQVARLAFEIETVPKPMDLVRYDLRSALN
jgi:hypothetical protein